MHSGYLMTDVRQTMIKRNGQNFITVILKWRTAQIQLNSALIDWVMSGHFVRVKYCPLCQEGPCTEHFRERKQLDVMAHFCNPHPL